MKKAIFASLLLAIAGASLAQVDPARVVATVNGVEIKGSEYYRRMEFLPNVGKNLGSGFAEFPPGFLTLEQLISEKLIFELAKQKGLTPSDAEVQAELDHLKTKNPNLVTDWLQSGRTLAELNQMVRFEVVQFKLWTAGVNVTDQEVDQFYKENKVQFTNPKQLTLRVIVADTPEKVASVDKDLAAGKPFADVAKAYSIDLSSKIGGEYGTVPVSALSENVRKGLGAVPAGKHSPWFTSADGKTKFRFLVEKITPESVMPLTAELRRQTRRALMLDRGKMKNKVREELNALRAKANIDIKEKGFADAYKRFIDAYLKGVGASG